MSDDINKMDFKQLRNEVQLLRDELAIMKRKYEDLLYNLDDDNFSSQFLKEKNGMKTSIEQTEESITLQAEKVKVHETDIATLKVTADKISSEVTEVKNDVSTNSTKITQNANAISSEVSARQEAVSDLRTEISQTAESIQMAVNATYSTPIEVTTWSSSNKDKSKVYYVTGENLYYHYDGYSWVRSVNATFGTLFEQTATGFKMTGNVQITEIAQVGKELKVGNIDDEGLKLIKFSESANIGTYVDHTGKKPPTGIKVSATSFNIDIEPEKIWIDGTTLADYVSQNGGGETVTAVFA